MQYQENTAYAVTQCQISTATANREQSNNGLSNALHIDRIKLVIAIPVDTIIGNIIFLYEWNGWPDAHGTVGRMVAESALDCPSLPHPLNVCVLRA